MKFKKKFPRQFIFMYSYEWVGHKTLIAKSDFDEIFKYCAEVSKNKFV